MNREKEALIQQLQPIVEKMGFQWVGLEYLQQGKYSLLRIYVDKEGGITVDDCGQISRQLGAVLDVENKMTTRYNLEVSSPGLDRPLFTQEHFKEQIGKIAAIHTREAIQGQKNFKGIIQTVNNEAVIISFDEKYVELPFKIIQRAHLLFMDKF